MILLSYTLGDVHMIKLIAQVTIQNMSKRDNIKIKLSVLDENEEDEVCKLHVHVIYYISKLPVHISKLPVYFYAIYTLHFSFRYLLILFLKSHPHLLLQ